MSEISEILNKYVRHQADDVEKRVVYDYILADPTRFELLIEMMRKQAMTELGMNVEDDFLPSHLQMCSPSEFAMSQAFAEYRQRMSASRAPIPMPPMMSPSMGFTAGQEFEDYECSADRMCSFICDEPKEKKSIFTVLKDALLK